MSETSVRKRMLELVRELERESGQPCELRLTVATRKGIKERTFAPLEERKIRVVRITGWKERTAKWIAMDDDEAGIGIKGWKERVRERPWPPIEGWKRYCELVFPKIERDLRNVLGGYRSVKELRRKLKGLSNRIEKDGPFIDFFACKISIVQKGDERAERALTYSAGGGGVWFCIGREGPHTMLHGPVARIEYELLK